MGRIAYPTEQSFTVLALDGSTYREHGMLVRGEQATSPTLGGLTLDVSAVRDAD